MDGTLRRRLVLWSGMAALLLPCTPLAKGAPRGGWPDKPWTYLYEARFSDGGGDGTAISGAPGSFNSLDGSWDHATPDSDWQGDLIDEEDAIPGGAELMVRDGAGQNEGGDATTDAEVLTLLDVGGAPNSNKRIYFERFLTDRSVLPPTDPAFDPAGAGQPAIDLGRGITISARFRFFSLDRLRADPVLGEDLGLYPIDVAAVGTGDVVDTKEYDESPRESFADQKGMFMVTRRDVYAPDQEAGILGAGGIYFGVAEDGDDSWDPSNQVQPPSPAQAVNVKIAYILGGPNNRNFAFQGSGDSRLIDQLGARGAQVTILDDNGPEGHQFHESADPGYTGDPGPDAVAHDFDLVIISSTVGSNAVATDSDSDPATENPDLGYRWRGVPFICWESGLVAKGYAWLTDPKINGFVVGNAPTSPSKQIEIVDDAHPITEGLALGVIDVFHSPQRMSATLDPFQGNTVAAGVTVLARNPAANPINLALLCVADPQSGPLGDGQPAEARQVFFFFEDESAAAMNGAGQQLFHRAVEWALGDSRAALLGPMPAAPPPPPATTVPSFYINLGATPAIAQAGLPFSTRVLKGSFLRDLSSPDPTVPALGGDTRVWAPLPDASLPGGPLGELVSVYITVAPEAGAEGPVPPIPRSRVKVYFNGSGEPAIEIEDHHLDPSILPAIAATDDGSGPNDGTGLGMGLWRNRTGGLLDVDYFAFIDRPVDPSAASENRFVRGNCNADAVVDISDAIFALGYLFLGKEDPDCIEACKTNPDDRLDLSDAVFLLSFLFTGGPSPPPPYPGCEAAAPAICAGNACP